MIGLLAKAFLLLVWTTLLQETKKTFPYLSDDRAHGITEHFTDALDRQSTRIASKADAMLVNELHKVHAIMSQIQVPPVDKKDQNHVERELIHHLLMYLDSQLMSEPAAQ